MQDEEGWHRQILFSLLRSHRIIILSDAQSTSERGVGEEDAVA